MTDHKPLLIILGQKGIPAMAANWLQRWAIILSSYTYIIQYKLTTMRGNADTLSMLPILADKQAEQDCSLTLDLD